MTALELLTYLITVRTPCMQATSVNSSVALADFYCCPQFGVIGLYCPEMYPQVQSKSLTRNRELLVPWSTAAHRVRRSAMLFFVVNVNALVPYYCSL